MASQYFTLSLLFCWCISFCEGLDPSRTDHIGKLIDIVNALNQTVENLIQENHAIKTEVKALKGEVSVLKATSANTTPVIAFYATLTPLLHNVGAQQIIKFDKEVTNVGNAYDSRIGHFTAPVKGVYTFSMVIMSLTGDYIHAELVKNGVRIALVEAQSDGTNTSTDVAVIVLDINDVVWVRNAESSSHGVYGYGYSTFSGYLIDKL